MAHELDELITGWPDPAKASIAITDTQATLGTGGDTTRVSRIASISKVVVGLTALVALEEGTIDLDDAVAPEGATVRHLLAHAAGYGFDTPDLQAGVGTRRIYSNVGIEVFADHLEQRAGMPFADYQREAVIEPLAMASTVLDGSPAHGLRSCVDDILRLARELLTPTLVARGTLTMATRPHFPELKGVLPGFGSFDPNPWGLGFEIRGDKSPHWTAPAASPAAFGHFGGAGTFLWVDPSRSLAAASISGTEYGPWANEAWPVANAALLERFG